MSHKNCLVRTAWLLSLWQLQFFLLLTCGFYADKEIRDEALCNIRARQENTAEQIVQTAPGCPRPKSPSLYCCLSVCSVGNGQGGLQTYKRRCVQPPTNLACCWPVVRADPEFSGQHERELSRGNAMTGLIECKCSCVGTFQTREIRVRKEPMR